MYIFYVINIHYLNYVKRGHVNTPIHMGTQILSSYTRCIFKIIISLIKLTIFGIE